MSTKQKAYTYYGLREAGFTFEEIASNYKVSKQSVQELLKRYTNNTPRSEIKSIVRPLKQEYYQIIKKSLDKLP